MLLPHYVLPIVLALALFVLYSRKDCRLNVDDMRELAVAYRLKTGKKGGKRVDSRAPLEGLVSVVTGATSGIGKELVQELYRLGSTVVVAGRSESKIKDTIAEIKRAVSDSSAGSLHSGLIDTSDLHSVKRFAEEISGKYSGGIDFLVNNAGIHYSSLTVPAAKDRKSFYSSPQGYDLAFATNYLGHFLLTKLLLPLLRKKSHAKIINVSSTFHMQADGSMLMPRDGGSAPLAARDDVGTFSHKRRSYSNNKLAQVLHAKELQRRIDGEGSLHDGRVKAFSMCPLWVSTNILGSSIGAYVVRLFAFTTNAVMVTPLNVLLSTDLQGGEYVTAGKVWLAAQSWSAYLFKGSAQLGLRDALCEVFAMYILLTQSFSYGFTIQRSSPESYDELLAKELYDWTDRAVSKVK